MDLTVETNLEIVLLKCMWPGTLSQSTQQTDYVTQAFSYGEDGVITVKAFAAAFHSAC